ncbi:MAG: hypothetical protein JO262_20205 [Solirubrobacterales bacterium]|nr:hypothetical protein [Solirubrobacterales bacterium]MBV9944462.1 hypothetical protein [Solirubrobacterales bacterium]
MPHDSQELPLRTPAAQPHYVNNGGYDLTVKNLPTWAAAGFTANRYRLDATNNMTLIDSTQHAGRSVELSADLPAPAVELIVIRATSAGPPTLQGVWSNTVNRNRKVRQFQEPRSAPRRRSKSGLFEGVAASGGSEP